MKITDFENMSDADLEGLSDSAFETQADEAPADQGGQEDQQQEQQEQPSPQPNEGAEGESEGEADAGGAEGDDKEGEKPKDEDLSDADLDKQDPPVPDKVEDDKKPAEGEAEKPVQQGEKKDLPEGAKPKEGDKSAVEAPAINYEDAYKKLIGTPIKANGTEITLKDADEAMRLIQKGAGYEKKMEQLKPARKAAAMLENAGLLGNDYALGEMLDIYTGNPKALAKLIKDLKIDIFELDLDGGDQYKPTSHLQSDEAVTFTETLKEVRTLEGGKEALALIDSWDQQSKDAIWGNATAVRQIYDYKLSGVYDQVATEVERRRTLGQIPAGTPFIQAFQMVGEEMAKAAQSQAASTTVEEPVTPPVSEPAKPTPRVPVHSGPVPRKAETPDARAAAAASPRVGAGAAKSVPDIYSLSDKDIENMSAPPV